MPAQPVNGAVWAAVRPCGAVWGQQWRNLQTAGPVGGFPLFLRPVRRGAWGHV